MPRETDPISSENQEKKSTRKNKSNYKKFTFFKNKKSSDPSREQIINEKLTAIYQGTDGKLPNMGKIEIKKSNIFLKIALYLLVIGTLFSVIAWINFLSSPSTSSSDRYIKFEFSGPDTVNFGTTSTYTIYYKNLNKNSLKNATIDLRYPSNFVFVSSSLPIKDTNDAEINLGTITPSTEGSITISGFLYGKTDQENIWRLSLNFQPEDINSPLLKSVTFKNRIKEAPYNLSVTAPDKIEFDKEVDLKFTIIKKESTPLANLELVPLVPYYFEIVSSSPKLDRTNRWIINAFSTTSSVMEFTIKGKSKEPSNSNLALKAQIFLTIPTTNQKISVAETSLGDGAALSTNTHNQTNLLSLTVNESTDVLKTTPGELLRVKNIIKNTSGKNIRDISLKLFLDAPSVNKQSVLNWNEVKDSYDGDILGIQLNDAVRRGQITWNKKTIPALEELKPNQEIIIETQIPIRQSTKFNFQKLSEHRIKAGSELHFLDESGIEKTVLSNSLSLSINSDTSFEARSNKTLNDLHQEEHEVTWILTNTLHPLKDIRLTATVNGDISWKNSTSTPAGKGMFEKNTRQITWTIPEMPESVDILAWPFSFIVNKHDPTQGAISISEVKIEATDIITNEKINLLGKELILK